MFNELGKLASLLKNAPEMLRQAKRMRGRMDELQEKLARVRVEGGAGGGMVKVTVNGHQKVVGVTLDPEVLGSDDRELLEDLIAAAVNQAVEKSKASAAEEMSRVMGDMSASMPPGLGDLLESAGVSMDDEEMDDEKASLEDEDDDDDDEPDDQPPMRGKRA